MSPPLVVPDVLVARARATPDRVALQVDGGAELTFGAWEARANAFATGLRRRGVRPGDRVGLLFDDAGWVEFGIAYFGTLKAGAVAVLLPDRFAPPELAGVLRQRGLVGVTVGVDRTLPPFDGWTERFEDVEGDNPTDPVACPVGPGDPAEIVHTSGTTGPPKGVTATHDNLLYRFRQQQQGIAVPHAKVLHALPIATTASQVMLLNLFRLDQALVVLPRFDAERFCQLARDHEVKGLLIVPALARWLLRSGVCQAYRLPSVELVTFTGAPLPGEVIPGLRELFPNARFINHYTSTEASPAGAAMEYDLERPDAVGRPVAETAVRILGEDGAELPAGTVGEVWLAADGALPRAYDQDRLATAETFVDGWTRTGDLGCLDADGYLHLTGRTSDFVNVAGFNVSTLEVESALARHPAVAEAAVYAVDHPVLGEVAAAAVVPAGQVTATELKRFAAEQLADYKVPATIQFLDDLPRNAMGKVKKHELAAAWRERPEEEPAAPRTETERALADIWQHVLGVERVGPHDDFLVVGGHSLAAVQVAARAESTFGLRLPANAVFDHPTLAEQAALVDSLRSAPAARAAGPVTHAPDDAIPQSWFQEFLTFGGRAVPSPSWNLSLPLRLRGDLDEEVLRRSLEEVVRRHEPLRSVLPNLDGRPVQVVRPAGPLDLPVTDLRRVPAERRTAEVHRLVAEQHHHAFDVAEGPLMLAELLRVDDDERVLLLTFQHGVIDQWSVGVLLRELGALYPAFAAGEPSPLPDLPLRYRDVAVQQRRQVEQGLLDGQLDYWAKRLEGLPAAHGLPYDRDPEQASGFQSAFHSRTVPAATVGGLRALSGRHQATLYMTLLAAWAAVLADYADHDDIALAVLGSARDRTELEPLIGALVNPLVLRTDCSGGPTFAELVRRVRGVALEAYANRDAPFPLVLERAPVAPTALLEAWLLMAPPIGRPAIEGLDVGLLNVPADCFQVKVPAEAWRGENLLVDAHERPDGSVGLRFGYNAELFEPATVEAMAGRYARMLELVVDGADRRAAELVRAGG